MKLLELIRGVVRPTLTWLGFGVVSVLAYFDPEVRKAYITMVGMMVAFWFADRTKTKDGK